MAAHNYWVFSISVSVADAGTDTLLSDDLPLIFRFCIFRFYSNAILGRFGAATNAEYQNYSHKYIYNPSNNKSLFLCKINFHKNFSISLIFND